MEEITDTFRVMYTTENLSFLENLFGRFTILKIVCGVSEPVLIMGFHKGKLLRGTKVPLRPGMHLNTLDELKAYLFNSMLKE